MRFRKLVFSICVVVLAEFFLCGAMILSKGNLMLPKRNILRSSPEYYQGLQENSIQNMQEPAEHLPENDIQPLQQNISSRYESPVNILLLGLDNDKTRTDTILFINFDPMLPRVNILSIERDLQVKVDGKKRKINSLYSIDNEKYVKVAVEKLTGMPVHYYATVDFSGFRKIIDTLGGVMFEVPFDMDYEDPAQNLYIHLKKGTQLLDGNKAEQLVRYRKGNKPGEGYVEGDVGRINTQQKFISALLSQKLKLKYLTRVNEIFSIFVENLETNISIADLTYYLPYLPAIGADDIKTFTMPGSSSYEDGVWYFYYNRKKTLQLIDKNFSK